MHNAIADALGVGEAFGPLMLEGTLESGETVVVGQGWCRGFMEGMRSQFDAWEPHLDMLNELVVPIAVLARFGDDDPERQALLDDRQKIAQLTDGIAESGPQSTPAAAPLPLEQENRTGGRPPRWGGTTRARAAAGRSTRSAAARPRAFTEPRSVVLPRRALLGTALGTTSRTTPLGFIAGVVVLDR
jgi:hypothetical protein